ncbi:putative membrane protein [Clostridium bornimense]|uniref:Putative membrane protein n=1 Tax=Clostridium bornimense TaxID=1216932 RepID=W6SFH2_9CLOT|nr:hypothetical protein [Clostridium bornimense]CDM68430.1 putative membrane protein [Clostridium bornimense]
MVYEIILSLMVILDVFGVVYVYQLLRNHAIKRRAEKRQQQLLIIKDTTPKIKRFKTTISDDIKFESEILCDKALSMLDGYR